MITLVCGTQNSGKSDKAETLLSTAQAAHKYYIATMKVFDEAGEERVEKHRRKREGKGFITMEIPYHVDRVLNDIEEPEDSALLLECVSNLAGNEMYDDPERALRPGAAENEIEALADAVLEDIKMLVKRTVEVIAVANIFPENDDNYDDETKVYVRLNNLLTCKIRQMADRVVDV